MKKIILAAIVAIGFGSISAEAGYCPGDGDGIGCYEGMEGITVTGTRSGDNFDDDFLKPYDSDWGREDEVDQEDLYGGGGGGSGAVAPTAEPGLLAALWLALSRTGVKKALQMIVTSARTGYAADKTIDGVRVSVDIYGRLSSAANSTVGVVSIGNKAYAITVGEIGEYVLYLVLLFL